jgi:hypothetical protein
MNEKNGDSVRFVVDAMSPEHGCSTSLKVRAGYERERIHTTFRRSRPGAKARCFELRMAELKAYRDRVDGAIDAIEFYLESRSHRHTV